MNTSNTPGEMSEMELLQQIAALYWLYQEDSSFYKAVTIGRVAQEILNKFSDESKIESLRNQTILSIATYVKEHPRARENELVREIQKQIEGFKIAIENM